MAPTPGDEALWARIKKLDQFAPDRARGPRHEGAADRRPDSVARARSVPILGWREPVTQAPADLGPRLVDQEAVAGNDQRIRVVEQDVALAPQSAGKPLVVLVGQDDELE